MNKKRKKGMANSKMTKPKKPRGCFPNTQQGQIRYEAQWDDDPMDIFHAKTDGMLEEDYNKYMGRE